MAEQVAQRLPLQELADDVGLTVVSTDVVDGDDVGVIERRRGLCFLVNRRRRSGSIEWSGRRTLMATPRPSRSSAGAIHFAHAATAEQIENPVRDRSARRSPAAIGGTCVGGVLVASAHPMGDRDSHDHLAVLAVAPDVNQRRRVFSSRIALESSACLVSGRLDTTPCSMYATMRALTPPGTSRSQRLVVMRRSTAARS